MNEMLNTISEALDAISEGITNVYTQKIYHYTSPDGLKGIFSQNTPALYFSQYDSLNDKKERIHFFEILKEYCDNASNNGIMSPNLKERIISLNMSDSFGILHKLNVDEIPSFAFEECYTYICSFSKNHNSSKMWERYTKTNNHKGACIEFFTHSFSPMKSYGKGFNINLVEVIYEKNKKFSLLESVLSPIMKVYDSSTKKEKHNYISTIKNMIDVYQFVFKEPKFSYEEEIRAILQVPKTTKVIPGIISERKERYDNDKKIPYVIYHLDPLSAITVTLSPTMTDKTDIINIKKYLVEKDQEHIDILVS